jgi:putative transposase
MPRKHRIDEPGAIHHIAALAVNREFAFRESADRRRLLAQLEVILDLYGWEWRDYCLMGTHFHLIVGTPKANLSRGMQHLCGTYAQWFNWKYGRRGHLFGRRFASVRIENDAHLLAAHRYVAMNPVVAGLCRSPATWSWSGFRALAGLHRSPPLLQTDATLRLFATQAPAARAEYRAFVEQVEPDAAALPLARTAGV